MKVDIKKLPQSAVEIVAELDLAEWGRFVDSAVRELAQETKIEGFRPGHAPRAVVEERLGQSKILEKAADLALRRSYQKIVEEQGLEIISRPEVQVLKLARDNPFEFKIKATVMPEVKLGDYQSLARVDKPKPAAEIKVEEPEVAEALKWLAKSRTQYVTVLRPAQKGDRLEVNFGPGKTAS